VPVSSRVAAPGFSGTPTAVGGFSFAKGIAVDAAGDIFIAQQTLNAVAEIHAGATSAVTLSSSFYEPTGLRSTLPVMFTWPITWIMR